jgi:hypothetical protein
MSDFGDFSNFEFRDKFLAIRAESPPVDITPLAIAAAVAIHNGHIGSSSAIPRLQPPALFHRSDFDGSQTGWWNPGRQLDSLI